MGTINRGLGCVLVLLVAGLLCLGPTQTMAQTTEPPGTGVTNPPPPGETDGDKTETPSTANPPAYIGELLKAGDLKQEQVDALRASGWGWGEIRIATRLAEQMAANSNGTLTFDAALAQVQAARADGKGFGQIAADNNLKVGQLVDNKKAGDSQNGSVAKDGDKGKAGPAAQQKKPGFFARIGRFLGFGRSADKPAKPQDSAQALQGDKPDHPVKPERATRAEKPARPEKPEKGPQKG